MIKTWIRHNASLTVGLLICIGLCVYSIGCASQAASVMRPGERVTAAELQIEVSEMIARHEAELKRVELSFTEIEKQDAIKQRLFEFGSVLAQSGGFNPVGLIGMLGLVLGPAAYVNGRTKDTIIKRDKTIISGLTPST